MNLFVKNIADEIEDTDLKVIFEKYGKVSSAKVVKDHNSGQSRGFGFVEMPDNNEALEALRELNGFDVKGKSLVISEARPKAKKRTSPGGRRNTRRW